MEVLKCPPRYRKIVSSAITIVSLAMFILSSCSTSRRVDYKSEIIHGRWCSVSSLSDYPHLTFFTNGYVTVDCKIDTVFGLKYKLKNNSLMLSNEGSLRFSNAILKLKSDTLILETFLENKSIQEYIKCK